MAARTGMSNLITKLRGMTAAGTADYTVNGAAYWTDEQLEDVLDENSLRIKTEALISDPDTSGATDVYKEYTWQYGDVEEVTSGSARWRVELSDGSIVGTATYSADYRQRRITFTNDTQGSAIYLSYYRYDLHGAAADVWDQKAAQVASRFDLETDNHNMKRSQLYAQYTKEAARHRAKAMNLAKSGMDTGRIIRDDAY